MELMSSAFLCVLVALLPQTLGKARNKSLLQDIKLNSSSSVIIKQKPSLRKGLLLNINGPPLVSNSSHLQSVYNDIVCKSCSSCMDRAIKANDLYVYMYKNRPSAEEFREDVLTNNIRTKRQAHPIVSDRPTENTSNKKGKSKKNRVQKSVTVTKYNVDNEIYALKVRETQVTAGQSDTKSATCQVYSVKKSYPCNSSEGDALLSAAKRKSNKKRNKKELNKPESTTTEVARPTRGASNPAIFRKREVYSAQVPESFMPSIEDIY